MNTVPFHPLDWLPQVYTVPSVPNAMEFKAPASTWTAVRPLYWFVGSLGSRTLAGVVV